MQYIKIMTRQCIWTNLGLKFSVGCVWLFNYLDRRFIGSFSESYFECTRIYKDLPSPLKNCLTVYSFIDLTF